MIIDIILLCSVCLLLYFAYRVGASVGLLDEAVAKYMKHESGMRQKLEDSVLELNERVRKHIDAYNLRTLKHISDNAKLSNKIDSHHKATKRLEERAGLNG